MTLVVGHVEGLRAAMYGDSRLSIATDGTRASNPLTGMLKTIIVAPRTAVGFAGLVFPSLDAIRTVAADSRANSDPQWVIDSLLAASKTSNGEVDFIVAHLAPTGAQLTTVIDATVKTGLSRGWVGQIEAFEDFQRAYHGHAAHLEGALADRLSPWEIEYSRHIVAMKAVIESSSVASVDDVDFYVKVGPGGFRYQGQIALNAGPLTRQPSPSDDGWTTMSFGGTPQEGSFTLAVLAAERAGPTPVAVHIGEAFAGAIYDPLSTDQPVVLRALNLRAFQLAVFNETGHKLVAAAWPSSVPPVPAASDRPGRNDPCWCGSTRKYKRCHHDWDRA